MVSTQRQQQNSPRCTFCPAGCELALAPAGPDNWATEYPSQSGQGLCPRGSALGELLSRRQRIFSAARRRGQTSERLDLPSALRSVVEAAGEGEIVLLLDGNIPCEQMAAAAGWCSGWPRAKLCLVVEPADRQLLLGTEASGADYLADEDLKDCDGFVIVGDAFSANPRCSRGVFDRRQAETRTPIVAIDPASGSAAKFATHRVRTRPGREASVLAAVASAAGVEVEGFGPDAAGAEPSAAEAGKAIARCRRLAVLVAAEHGRTASWRQIGFIAGRLAKALGGGVAPQTVGANALAAVRLEAKLSTISLAQALSQGPNLRVAIGCDVLGMLGQSDVEVFAAAAPFANCTTAAAEIILPLAMAGEYGGTYLLSGARPVDVRALMRAAAGVPSPAELVEALASAAGATRPQGEPAMPELARRAVEAPAPAPAPDLSGKLLALGRQTIHAGCGTFTAHGSWQSAVEPLPELRICPADAAEAQIENLAVVTVSVNGQSLRAQARLAPELSSGTFVLPEGSAEARRLMPGRIDLANDAIVTEPVSVNLSADEQV